MRFIKIPFLMKHSGIILGSRKETLASQEASQYHQVRLVFEKLWWSLSRLPKLFFFGEEEQAGREVAQQNVQRP